jgi:hypothetical protein
MTHELAMGDDGILRLAWIGDVDEADAQAFLKDYAPFVDAATTADPVLLLYKADQTGKVSSAVRKTFGQLNKDPRLGKMAIVGASRVTQVLATFVLKSSGRNNIRFFSSEADGLVWLKAKD